MHIDRLSRLAASFSYTNLLQFLSVAIAFPLSFAFVNTRLRETFVQKFEQLMAERLRHFSSMNLSTVRIQGNLFSRDFQEISLPIGCPDAEVHRLLHGKKEFHCRS